MPSSPRPDCRRACAGEGRGAAAMTDPQPTSAAQGRRRRAGRARAGRAARRCGLHAGAGSMRWSLAAGWAIMEPARNRTLAELAVRDTGLGAVADKIVKNHRKTLGLLRDLRGAMSTGVLAEYPDTRDHGDRASGRRRGRGRALDQSGRHARQQCHQRAEVRQCRHPVALAQGPLHLREARSRYIHAEFARIGAPRGPRADAARAGEPRALAPSSCGRPISWS